MRKKNTKPLLIVILIAVALVIFIVYQNKLSNTGSQQKNTEKPVVIAYQTGVDPGKVAQANGDYEKNSHSNIQWKKFDSGTDVVNALASGDVVIGNIGSSPFAAATSRNLPIETFLVTSQLGESEALLVRDKIRSPQDLIGKTIAVPFVSTTHYSLLSALKHWGIAEQQVKIINLRPPEIAAAWQRGDIDGAYVWEPVLGKLKNAGHVLTDSKQVGEWGAPTYDLWVVRKDFAEKHPEFLKSFVQTTLKQVDVYNQDPKAYVTNVDNLSKISELTGSDAQNIAVSLAGNTYLNAKEQQTVLASQFAKNIFDTATFLKAQGKVDQVKVSYADDVTTAFLQP
ncbi:taurine ABC transporter substrate-binding protein [Acinetobacter sp. MD2(2019)]|uniref:taurine ABC transporter substrate-binding protein n=1 Tax=Acinetobacter sp. MD2(2019) TaxID=2605273 RepID=UPI002D1E6F77|nr:taurine ABC transporter substrate-binding protein [Acinetobacter sp. MD2(2019)]MEB3754980.1 taurine ABC transporter substrate-binding protein [Acinetobacter sp. MD2(2019)]